LISQLLPHTSVHTVAAVGPLPVVVQTRPPELELELLELLELDELLLEELLLEELLLEELLLDELLLELPEPEPEPLVLPELVELVPEPEPEPLVLPELVELELAPVTTTTPLSTVGAVGMPPDGFIAALTGTFTPPSEIRSALLSWPSSVTSIGVTLKRAPLVGSRSKVKPEPPFSHGTVDGISVENTSLPLDRIGCLFMRSPVPVFDQVVEHEGCGVQVSAKFGKSRYQPRWDGTL